MPIDWKPLESLTITPNMENRKLLLYVKQVKLCSRIIPEVITADIVDGAISVCGSHHLEPKDWRISTITHYAWLNEPYNEPEPAPCPECQLMSNDPRCCQNDEDLNK